MDTYAWSRLVAVVAAPVLWFWAIPQLVDTAAAVRDRLRSHTSLHRPRATLGRGWVTVDISRQARRERHGTSRRFLTEIVALEVAIGLFIGSVATGHPLGVVPGAFLAVALRRRTVFARADVRGRHRPSSVAALLLAAAIALVGVGIIAFGPFLGPNLLPPAWWATVVTLALSGLLGLGALRLAAGLSRLGTRIRLSRPRRVTAGDPPPMLYLRSFSDDALRIRVAPFARVSFVERLSARRKQGFEEVLAEELRLYGPVLAIRQDETALAPVGFGRDVFLDHDWQDGVLDRLAMVRAAVIVLGSSAGLRWEIDAIVRSGAWLKSIIIFPPLPPHELLRRWSHVADLLGLGSIRAVRPPGRTDHVVAMTFTRHQECRFYYGRRADAWDYKTALSLALRDIHEEYRQLPGESASPTGHDPSPSPDPARATVEHDSPGAPTPASTSATVRFDVGDARCRRDGPRRPRGRPPASAARPRYGPSA